jgi:hypothetical protein
VELYLHSPNTPWCGAQLKHRDNFASIIIVVVVVVVIIIISTINHHCESGGGGGGGGADEPSRNRAFPQLLQKLSLLTRSLHKAVETK